MNGINVCKRMHSAWQVALGSLLLCCATSLEASDLDLRLQVTWGGGEARLWQGSIRVSGGTCQPQRSLGIESDAPTAIEAEPGGFRFWQHNAVSFDGFVIRVMAPASAKLLVQLSADKPGGAAQPVEISLADFTTSLDFAHKSALANQQNSLVVRRAPGDPLRLVLERDTLVFEPGEWLQFRVQPRALGAKPDSSLRLNLHLQASGSDEELWREQKDLIVDENGSAGEIGPVRLQAPDAEGVYELVLSLQQRGFSSNISAITRTKEMWQQKVQFVVVGPGVPEAAAAADDWHELDVMELTSGEWWKRWNWLPHFRRLRGVNAVTRINDTGAISSDALVTVQHLERSLTQLPGNGWYAAPIPIARIGQPHLLELEYPNDFSQTLGVSILEANAAGLVVPLGIDSGIDVPAWPAVPEAQVERHRLLFWPRTKTPWLLLTNRRADDPAVFGQVRVLAGPEHLPASGPGVPAGNERLLAAYYDKPFFPENFSAPEALDTVSNRSLEDWNTFYQGGRRLVEYLKYAGYNAAVISVLRDGGSLYPSRCVPTTPKYDTGAFFVNGQDPVQKDVLELLFRLFDREGLRLIPALQFSCPLPELDQALRGGGPQAAGIELVGVPAGGTRPLSGQQLGRRGAAPYYNPLDERVQAAVANVVTELTTRYAQHQAFAGVCLQLTPESYVVLPDECWPCDDRTIARFQDTTQLTVPGDAAQRYLTRSQYLGTTGREAWRAWRAAGLAEFYTTLRNRMAEARADARLYLACEGLLTGRPAQEELRPRLFARPDVAGVLARYGLDPAAHRDGNVVLLRPQRQAPLTSLAAQGANLQTKHAADVDAGFRNVPIPGTLMYHEPLILRLPDFDRQSPFGAEQTRTWLAAQIPPTSLHARENLVHGLAAYDAQVLVTGGWTVPLGQEDAARNLFHVFRQLPAAPFQSPPVQSPSALGSSVTVRTLTAGNQSYLYVANDAPWETVVELELAGMGNGGLRSLSGAPLPPVRPHGPTSSLTIELSAYDLVAAVVPARDFSVQNWCVSYRRDVEAELNALVTEVKTRVNELRRPQPLTVLANPGFEALREGSDLPGWTRAQRPGIVVETVTTEPRGGKQCLHMRGDDANSVAWIRSEPFAPPKTGQIYVLAWIRTRDAQKQPPLRLAIDGMVNGESYYRFAPLGVDVDAQNRRPTGQPAQPLSSEWSSRPFLLPIDDLPTTGLTELLVGFDLMGSGEVWIDDVQVFDLYFQVNEQDELLKNAAAASYQLENGKIADCTQYLDGYWPRFLLEHVPAPPLMTSLSGNSSPNTPPEEPSPPKTENSASGWNRFVPKVPLRMPFRKSGKSR
jgi:hypothetical protein